MKVNLLNITTIKNLLWVTDLQALPDGAETTDLNDATIGTNSYIVFTTGDTPLVNVVDTLLITVEYYRT